jgi:hypothetical protein
VGTLSDLIGVSSRNTLPRCAGEGNGIHLGKYIIVSCADSQGIDSLSLSAITVVVSPELDSYLRVCHCIGV